MSRTTSFSAAAVLVGLVIFFALFEIGLRIAFYRSMDFDIEMWKYATVLKKVADDPAQGHEHAPGKRAFLMGVDVEINSRKLRDYDYDFAKPAGVKRVLMVGDSLTFGWGVPVEETAAKRLESRLNAAGGKWQVINAGVGNYNTSQEVAYFFNEGYRYKPDVVVLNYFVNDAEPTPVRKTHPLLGWSYAYVYLKGRFDLLGRQAFGMESWADYYLGLYEGAQPGWLATVASIDKLADYCRENGIPLVIANYPELHDLENYRFANVGDRLRQIAGRGGAVYVDLLDAVRGEPAHTLWVTPSDPHPNGRANRLFADHLLPVVEKAAAGR